MKIDTHLLCWYCNPTTSFVLGTILSLYEKMNSIVLRAFESMKALLKKTKPIQAKVSLETSSITLTPQVIAISKSNLQADQDFNKKKEEEEKPLHFVPLIPVKTDITNLRIDLPKNKDIPAPTTPIIEKLVEAPIQIIRQETPVDEHVDGIEDVRTEDWVLA